MLYSADDDEDDDDDMGWDGAVAVDGVVVVFGALFFDFINSLSFEFLHFIRLFWNQIFTCESFRFRRAANFFRSGLLMYFCLTKADSSPFR